MIVDHLCHICVAFLIFEQALMDDNSCVPGPKKKNLSAQEGQSLHFGGMGVRKAHPSPVSVPRAPAAILVSPQHTMRTIDGVEGVVPVGTMTAPPFTAPVQRMETNREAGVGLGASWFFGFVSISCFQIAFVTSSCILLGGRF